MKTDSEMSDKMFKRIVIGLVVIGFLALYLAIVNDNSKNLSAEAPDITPAHTEIRGPSAQVQGGGQVKITPVDSQTRIIE